MGVIMFFPVRAQQPGTSIFYRPSLSDKKMDTITVLVSGTIGSGQKTLCAMLAEQGYTTILFQDIANGAIWTEENKITLVKELGRTILHTHDGVITYDFGAIRGMLFDDNHPETSVLRQEFLRKEFHGVLLAEAKQRIRAAQESGHKIVFVENTTGLEDSWITGISADKTVCVFASERNRIDRLQQQGVGRRSLEAINKAHFSVAKKASCASVVIVNNGRHCDLRLVTSQLTERLEAMLSESASFT